MSKKTAAVGAVAFVAVAGFVAFGLWKASQPAPEVFQGQRQVIGQPDVFGAAVVIEQAATEGLDPVQIADYASLRLLAPTGEVDVAEADAPRTIMTLFVAPTDAPAAMTRFDRAYLKALYRMPAGAFASEVLRAAVVDVTRGTEDER